MSQVVKTLVVRLLGIRARSRAREKCMSKKLYWTLPAWQRNVIELEEIASYYLLKTTSIARGIQYLQWAKEIRMAHGQ